jgi:hypothetical protein
MPSAFELKGQTTRTFSCLREKDSIVWKSMEVSRKETVLYKEQRSEKGRQSPHGESPEGDRAILQRIVWGVFSQARQRVV